MKLFSFRYFYNKHNEDLHPPLSTSSMARMANQFHWQARIF